MNYWELRCPDIERPLTLVGCLNIHEAVALCWGQVRKFAAGQEAELYRVTPDDPEGKIVFSFVQTTTGTWGFLPK